MYPPVVRNAPASRSVLLALGMLLLWAAQGKLHGQCGPNVPSFVVDLSLSPTATWTSPWVQRLDNCCGTTPPDVCVEFVITLHPAAQGITFDICDGAVPGGAMFYQVGCGPSASVGQPLCLNGPGPHFITFCKPGNNTNLYCIASVPAPSAGPDIGINDGCAGTLTSSGFAPGTVQWTSIAPGAQGAYDNYLGCSTCATTTVTSQPGPPPFVDYLICGNAVSPCTSVVYCDTLRVQFFSSLGASISPPFPVVCFGGTGVTLTSNGSGGTPPYNYLWSTGATSQSIQVTSPGTYTVQLTDTSGCPGTMASIDVLGFSQPITADTGPDIIECNDGFPIPINGSVTGVTSGQWSGGGGQFLPHDSALSATYLPSPAEMALGQFQLYLSTTGNNGCPGDTDTLTISWSTLLENGSLVGTDPGCNGGGDGSILYQTTSSGLSYQWNDPLQQTTNPATGLAAGTYSVTVSDPYGCDTTLSTTLTEPAAITIAQVQVTDESCLGSGDGTATVSATGGTPPYSYSWSTGASGPSITAGAGTYTVSVTDANGCAPAQATATIGTFAQPNVANAGADLIACSEALPVQLNGTVQNATGGIWSGGQGTFIGTGLSPSYQPTATELLAGSVQLVLTTTGNTTCPPDQDTVQITLSNSFLNAQVLSYDLACHGAQNGSAAYIPALPGLTYQWSDPSAQTTATAFGLAAGTYTLVVTDGLGCDSTFNVTITEPPPLSIDTIQALMPTCNGGSDGGANALVSGGTPGYTYQWSSNAGGQNTPSAGNLGVGTYIVVVTDANGCMEQASVTITQPPPIALSATVPDTVCVNDPVALTAQASGGSGGLLIEWDGIGFGPLLTYSFPSDQTVQVSVTDANGCSGPVLTFPVTVLDLNAGTLVAYGDTTVCPGGFATVRAEVLNYPAPVNYTWPQLGLTGPGPYTIPVTASQVLDVIATDGCAQLLSEQVTIGLEVPPVVELPPLIAEGCAPLDVQFPPGPSGQFSYFWDLGDGTTSTSPAPLHTYQAGTYNTSLTVTTPAGCSATSTGAGAVIVHALPQPAFIADPWTTSIDAPTVQFTDQSGGSIMAHWWEFGDGMTSDLEDPDHTYSSVGNFPVTLWVEDQNGCTNEVVRTVTITPNYELIIPNVFTPDANGSSGGYYDPLDLSNDVFYPFVKYVSDFRMRIYDRWGELIFETNELARGWDGYYRGQLSQQDAYVYQVWVRFVDGKELERTGDVTLMR